MKKEAQRQPHDPRSAPLREERAKTEKKKETKKKGNEKKNGTPVLFLRPVSKKCMVKGCKNTRSMAISRNPEFGNTVILCEECRRALTKGIGEESNDGT